MNKYMLMILSFAMVSFAASADEGCFTDEIKRVDPKLAQAIERLEGAFGEIKDCGYFTATYKTKEDVDCAKQTYRIINTSPHLIFKLQRTPFGGSGTPAETKLKSYLPIYLVANLKVDLQDTIEQINAMARGDCPFVVEYPQPQKKSQPRKKIIDWDNPKLIWSK